MALIDETTKKKLTEIFEETKTLFQSFMSVEKETPKPEQKFMMEGVTGDGTKVMIDGEKPSVGVKVMAVDSEGKEFPIPNGEYEVKIGEEVVKIKCEGGVITESSLPPATTPETPPAETEQKTDTPPADDKYTALEQRIVALEEAIKGAGKMATDTAEESKQIVIKLQTQVESAENENKNMRKTMEGVLSMIEKILDTPTVPSTHAPSEIDKAPMSFVDQFRKRVGTI